MNKTESGFHICMNTFVHLLRNSVGLLNRCSTLNLDMQPGMDDFRPDVLCPQVMNALYAGDRQGSRFDPFKIFGPRGATQQETPILSEQLKAIVGDDCGDYDGCNGIGDRLVP